MSLKNSLTGLSKVLAAYTGCMVIALGLMLPAYGQGVTDPDCGENAAVAMTGVTAEDMNDPSSFAAGCNAEAGTDGSIAIGDNAKVESYMITTPGELGQTTHDYDPDGSGTDPSREVSVRDGMIYEIGEDGVLIGTIGESAFEDDNAAYSLEKRTGADAPDAMVTTPVERAVAIGADSSVTGDNGVALGAGTSTEENGIAIGAGVTAGENQIVIGTADQSAIIGGVDLAKNVTDIATNRAGIAMAIAFAHLPSVSAGDRGSWGLGAGSFDGKSALAAGLTYHLEGKKQIKVGVSASGGKTSFGLGFGMGF